MKHRVSCLCHGAATAHLGPMEDASGWFGGSVCGRVAGSQLTACKVLVGSGSGLSAASPLL